MTPPSLSVAREILASAESKARNSGDPFTAEAIRVVLDRITACEAQEASVHGAASVIKVVVSDPQRNAIARGAIMIGSRLTGVRSILSRGDAREVFGRRDGDAVWDAFGRAPTPVFIAAVPEAPAPVQPASIAPHAITHGAAAKSCSEHACIAHPSCLAQTVLCGCPECQRARASATTHGTAILPEALVANMLPCPFCGRTDGLRVESHPDRGLGPQNTTLACVRCRECGCAGPARAGGPGDRAQAIERWNCRASPPPDADRCATCGAALPLSAGRRGCAECYDPDAPP